MKSLLQPFELFVFSAVCLLSFIGGGLNGIIGTGSGIFFMLCAALIRKYTSTDCDIYSLSMSCVIPVSIVSLFLYQPNLFDPNIFVKMFIPGVAGGILGAYIKGKIKTHWLSLAFAVLTIYSGISMIMNAING